MHVKSSWGIQLRACAKWVLSFRKHDWELADYPVYIREQIPDPSSPFDCNSRFKLHPYIAGIEKWPLSGFGESRQDALNALELAFAERKAALATDGKPLPRPGTRVPITFASQGRVFADRELADEFIHQVLGLDWAFISDESSLWDFHSEETNEKYLVKIKEIYGISVDDIESARLCEIFDRLADARLNRAQERFESPDSGIETWQRR